MYTQDTYGNQSCTDRVFYPRFGGDLGSERHWDVEDVKRLLFGSFDAPRSQDMPDASRKSMFKPFLVHETIGVI